MKPTKTDDDALVDLLDVILEKGVVLQADVVISVADIPLVGVQLRAALAGMDTMTDYGLFEEWDARHRSAARSDDEPTAFVGRPGDSRPQQGRPGGEGVTDEADGEREAGPGPDENDGDEKVDGDGDEDGDENEDEA